MDIVDAAYRQLTLGNAAVAVEMMAKASAERNGDAAAELGLWYLAGDKIGRDLGKARHFLAIAANNNHVNSAHIEAALTANGTGAPPDWQKAIQLLERLARSDTAARHQMTLLTAMNLDGLGYPKRRSEGVEMHTGPDIHVVKQFCSPDECNHIALTAAPSLQPATVFDPQTGQRITHPIRVSDDASLGPVQETLVVQAVNRRIARVTETDVMQGEPLTILRYGIGQQYRPHLDVLPKTINQRRKTAILYLNDDYVGGETDFPLLDVRIVPRLGDLLIFDNLDASDGVEPLSQHAGRPVLGGTKWIATRWIRTAPYNPWTDYGK